MSSETLLRVMAAQAEYAHCIDEGLLEGWPELFLEQCLYLVTTSSNYRQNLDAGLIWADTRGMLRDRVSALRKANIYERQTYRHLCGTPVIVGEDGRQVSSETPFLVARVVRDGPTDIFATGRYVDRYEVTCDALMLAERIVVCDTSQIDTLLAIPL
jgi:anthranilate 1,2-dioxygenase small subunit